MEALDNALPLLDSHAESVRIPFEQTTLKATFLALDDSGVARPTIVFPCGYDSTLEEGWIYVPSALARGYNAFVFKEPSQGGALSIQDL